MSAATASVRVHQTAVPEYRGNVLDSRTVELDDSALTALQAAGGKLWAVTPSGDLVAGQLVHDGSIFVAQMHTSLGMSHGVVVIRPRGVT